MLPTHLLKVLDRVAGKAEAFALGMEREVIQELNLRVATFDDRFAAEAMSDERIARLMSMPCVGPVLATTFVAIVDDPNRFADGGQLAAYLGLVPSEHSSGDSTFKGRITKVGPAELRRLLVSAGWLILNSKDAGLADLRKWGKHIGKKSGIKAKGSVALARKLCTILLTMWKKKENFRGATRIDATAETTPVKKPQNKLQQNATRSRRNLERAKREISERSTSASPKVEANATETSPSGPASETSRPPRKPRSAETTKAKPDATRLTSLESEAQPTCASSPTDERLPGPSTRTFVLQTATTTNARKPVRSA